MQLVVIQRVLGILLTLFSTALIPPLAISIVTGDNATTEFLESFLIILVAGLLLALPVYRQERALRLRDGFVIVVLFWTVLGIAGGLPLYLYDHTHLTLMQAIFESISGLTTTGATVIVGLEELPPSILFYRQELQWLGGMGIIGAAKRQ